MQKLFVIIIAMLLVLPHFFSQSFAQTPTAEPTSESVTEALSEQITNLKEKIASRVAELDLVEKRGIVGEITDVDGTQITIEDNYGNTRLIDVDEITEFDSPDAGETFGISDMESGMQISVLGLYNKQSERILARFINEVTLPQFITGSITAIDENEFTIVVTTNAETNYTVDIETTTDTQAYVDEDFESSGFSQMEIDQTIFVTGSVADDEEHRLQADRILLFPTQNSSDETENRINISMPIHFASLQKKILSSPLDAFLISSYANISYISGFFGFSQKERDAYIVVTKNRLHLFTNQLYARAFDNLPDTFSLHITSSSKPFTKQLHDVLKKEHIRAVGFEEDTLTVSEFSRIQKDGVDFIPDTLSHLREIKSPDEIQDMQSACSLTETVFEELLKKNITPGMTEKELAKTLEMIVIKHNAEFSFPAIVAFGKNAAIPHHHTGETKLQKNDLILIDFGITWKNYSSDMTRTFFIGMPSSDQKKVYDVVKKSQEKAVEYLSSHLETQESKKTELKASEVDKIARDYITSQGYPSIPHSLGHGIGIEVHETPSLSPFSKDILQNGHVFSIEPGIYLHNKFGIRIEDLYAIHDNTLIPLTQSSKDLIAL